MGCLEITHRITADSVRDQPHRVCQLGVRFDGTRSGGHHTNTPGGCWNTEVLRKSLLTVMERGRLPHRPERPAVDLFTAGSLLQSLLGIA